MLRLLCGRKLGAVEINMNDLVFEYQHNRTVTAKEEDEIDTRPDEQMQNVQNKISLYFVGCILRYIRADVYGILPKLMKMEIAECTETESNMKDLVSEYQQYQRTTKEKDCRVLPCHSPEEGVPSTVHQPCQGRNNGIRRGREQHEPFCLRIPAVTGCDCRGRRPVRYPIGRAVELPKLCRVDLEQDQVWCPRHSSQMLEDGSCCPQSTVVFTSCVPEVDDETRVWRAHIEQQPELKLNEIKIAPQSKTNEEICVEQTVIQLLDVLYKLMFAENTYTATTEAKQREKRDQISIDMKLISGKTITSNSHSEETIKGV